MGAGTGSGSGSATPGSIGMFGMGQQSSPYSSVASQPTSQPTAQQPSQQFVQQQAPRQQTPWNGMQQQWGSPYGGSGSGSFGTMGSSSGYNNVLDQRMSNMGRYDPYPMQQMQFGNGQQFGSSFQNPMERFAMMLGGYGSPYSNPQPQQSNPYSSAPQWSPTPFQSMNSGGGGNFSFAPPPTPTGINPAIQQQNDAMAAARAAQAQARAAQAAAAAAPPPAPTPAPTYTSPTPGYPQYVTPDGRPATAGQEVGPDGELWWSSY